MVCFKVFLGDAGPEIELLSLSATTSFVKLAHALHHHIITNAPANLLRSARGFTYAFIIDVSLPQDKQRNRGGDIKRYAEKLI